ncbi:MAG: hypothetical protein ACRDJE_02355 [Dehalococcoidia bacterium]
MALEGMPGTLSHILGAILAGVMALVAAASSGTTGTQGETGSITGELGYPSHAVPPLLVYAIRVDVEEPQSRYVRTEFNQLNFTIDGLEPGVYVVVAYLEEMPSFAGGYTEMVPCGLTVECTDHTLIPIAVGPGETVEGIAVRDWYAPPGTFPERPREPE